MRANDPLRLDEDSKKASEKFARLKVPLLGIALFSLYLYFVAPGSIPEINKLLGLALIIACLVPSLVYLQKLESGSAEPLPLLPLIGLIYSLYLAFPAFIDERPLVSRIYLPPEQLTDALALALLGWVVLLGSFYLLGTAVFSQTEPLRLQWNPEHAKNLAVLLMLTGLLVQGVELWTLFPPEFRSAVQLVGSFFDLGLGIFILLDSQGRLGRGERQLLWFIAVPYFLFIQLASGLVSSLIFASVYVFLLVWATTRKFHWPWAALFLLAVVLLRGSVGEYRQAVWYGPFRDASNVQKAELFIDIVLGDLEAGGEGKFTDDFATMVQRVAQLELFGHVVELTPDQVPYWKGESYRTLPTTWIPRAIWPGKPEKRLGQEFGHRYGILDPWDRSTSVNFPQIVEMYANFGPVGVLVGMALLGLVYRALYAKLNRPGVTLPVILIGAYLFKDLINIESDFSLVFGSVMQKVVVLYIVLSLASTGQKSRSIAADRRNGAASSG